MTRLDDTRRKKYFSQLGMYVFLFILIIVFFSTIGIKLLISASLFVADLQHKPQVSENYGDLSAPPEITDIPDATNSATIIIAGRAAAKKNISVYVNDEKQKDVVTDENGFSTDITLSIGENTVYVELIDQTAKLSKKSSIYKVIYSNKKPRLEITSPIDQDKTNKDDITVNGLTDLGVEVKINGSPIVLGADATFSHSVNLKEGENKIHIEAIDAASNTESKDLTITYQKD